MVDDDNKRQIVNEDIKRILIDRDITTIKQAFYRILCSEIRNNGARIFIPHKLFSQNRLQSYLSSAIDPIIPNLLMEGFAYFG
jgi:hypothetical protein